MNFSRQHWLALCCVVLGIIAIALHSLTRSDVVIREDVIASSSGNPLRIRLILPKLQHPSPSQDSPALIAIPPYNIPAEVMQILCTEFARRGVACVIPDFLGKSPAESRQNMGRNSLDTMTQDVLSIVEFLRSIPWIHPAKIGVCGHSVGGTVAFLAGLDDSSIRTVVPIGMETEMPPQHPQNLLLLAGLYDEIRTPRALLRRLHEYGVAPEPQVNTRYGQFANGTARQVSLSLTSDHFIEPMDPMIIRQLLHWHASAFEWPELEHGSLFAWWHAVAALVIIITSTLLYALSVIHVFSYRRVVVWRTKYPRWLEKRIHVFPLCCFLILLWWAGNISQPLRFITFNLMVSLPALHLFISGDLSMSKGKIVSVENIKDSAIVLLALSTAFFLTCFLVNIPFFVRFPGVITWYPVFVGNMLVLFPLQVWLRFVVALFSETLTACAPNIGYLIFLGCIILLLDWPVRVVNQMAGQCLAACRKTFRWREGSFSARKWVVFLVVWGVFSGLAYRRMAEGMLTAETLLAGSGLLLRLILLPGLIFLLLIRLK